MLRAVTQRLVQGQFANWHSIRRVPISHWFIITLIVLSALTVVYTKQISRTLFIELQSLQKERDDLYVEWTQLLIEQSVFAAEVLIDETARQELNMISPEPAKIIMVKPE